MKRLFLILSLTLIAAGTAAAATPIQVSAGASHTCVIDHAGGLWCMGDNTYGQLGLGSTGGSTSSPSPVYGFSSGVTKVVTGLDFTCALKGADVYCWGRNNNGQLGNGCPDPGNTCDSTTDQNVPTLVYGPYFGGAFTRGAMTDLAGDGEHACVIYQSQIWCWGLNDFGQLGLHVTYFAFTQPAPVNTVADVIPTGTPIAIEAGPITTCAIYTRTAGGTIPSSGNYAFCWGSTSTSSATQTNYVPDAYVPVSVTAPGHVTLVLSNRIKSLAVGGDRFGSVSRPIYCVVTAATSQTSELGFCLGYGVTGALGQGTTTSLSAMARWPGFGSIVAAGFTPVAWSIGMAATGRNVGPYSVFQSGVSAGVTHDKGAGSYNSSTTPLTLPTEWMIGLTGGYAHQCGLTTLYPQCWGSNTSGQLGDGTTTDRTAPTTVLGPFTGGAW